MWTGVQFSAPFGGGSVLGSWHRSSATCLSGFRGNREVTPVKVQKGGEWGGRRV